MISPSQKGKKIIVVEDDPDSLFLMGKVLENAGYFVECFQDGSHLFDAENYVLPDLFILDKKIGMVDGLKLCNYLKAQKVCKAIPVVMISGSPEFEIMAIREGADHFLIKPLKMSHLLKIVHSSIVKSIKLDSLANI